MGVVLVGLEFKDIIFRTMSISSPMTSAGGCLGSGFSRELRAFIAVCLPSWCEILVYRDGTSVDARMHLSGSGVFLINRINSVVSFINEGRSLIRG